MINDGGRGVGESVNPPLLTKNGFFVKRMILACAKYDSFFDLS
jgi:hypothetical protein